MAREKVLNNKNQIIDVAFTIIDEEGVEALSARRIAKELSISSTTVYNYVKNIDEIKKEVLIRCFNILFKDIFVGVDVLNDVGKYGLPAFAKAYAMSFYDFSNAHPYMAKFIIGEGLIKFYSDAELRLFFRPFESFVKLDKEREIYRMFEDIVMFTIYRGSARISNMTREEFEHSVDVFEEKMMPDTKEIP